MSDLDGHTIVLLDDDPFALESMALIIDSFPDCRVLWRTQDAKQAIDCCLTPSDRPDVLLLDMSLGLGWSGVDVCASIRRRTDAVPVLAITSFPVHRYSKTAALAGAQGIVSKSDRTQMASALRTVANGGTWGDMFDNALISHIRLRQQPQQAMLSQKESTVMNMLVTGSSVSDVAETMQCSESTVKSFLSRAKKKLGASTLRKAIALWTGESNE